MPVRKTGPKNESNVSGARHRRQDQLMKVGTRFIIVNKLITNKECTIWLQLSRCSTSLCWNYRDSKLSVVTRSKPKEYIRMAHSGSCFRWELTEGCQTPFCSDRILLMIFAATFLFGSAYFYSEIGRHPVPDHPFKVIFSSKCHSDSNFRLG